MKADEHLRAGFFSSVKYDLPAGIVVFFVAVPLCLGIALASGAPLFSGLIAGIVGGIVVGAVSNSSLGVSGPAAGLTVIVFSAIQQLGSFQVFLAAVVIAGVLQILLGLIRAGIIAYYFPSSVIKGMLTAIGIIIILKQIPHAFGYDADYEGDFTFLQMDGHNTFSELIYMLEAITPGAIVVSIISLTILFLWEAHLSKKYPALKLVQGPLVAVVVGIAYQFVTAAYFPELSLSSQHLVNVPVSGSPSEFFAQFMLPDFTAIARLDVWIVGVTLAIVASVESLLSTEAIDKLDPYKRLTNTNRELIAQGTGNMLSGLIGGLPVTQVILRSSANVQSGGKTKLSTIFHGMLLLLCVILIPRLLNAVPLAVLASILLVIGYKLANPFVFKQMARLGWSQFLPFIATITGIVFTDLLKGISIGLIVSIVILLRNSYKNSHSLRHEKMPGGSKRVKIVLAEEVFFLNKGRIKKELNDLPHGISLVIDMTKSLTIDYDVLEVIDDFRDRAKMKHIDVTVIGRDNERLLVTGDNEKKWEMEKAEADS
ncbi:MAG TPA: SulP family inorganic anion transporter [Chryseolinea sp.]|nr:SulP family inorganic anion transporter [Chryseolinea sp.]